MKSSIENDIASCILCLNSNRVGIMHLLRTAPGKEMQVEKIAYSLGISHRTTIYHLDILKSFGYTEVRKFKNKGGKMIRCVWGLNLKNKGILEATFSRMEKNFSQDYLESIVNRNIIPRNRRIIVGIEQ